MGSVGRAGKETCRTRLRESLLARLNEFPLALVAFGQGLAEPAHVRPGCTIFRVRGGAVTRTSQHHFLLKLHTYIHIGPCIRVRSSVVDGLAFTFAALRQPTPGIYVWSSRARSSHRELTTRNRFLEHSLSTYGCCICESRITTY